MENYQSQLEELPSAGESFQIVRCFLGQVPRPDDKELRKGQVRPQHDESQCELSKVVKVGGCDGNGHGSSTGKISRCGDRKRESRQHLAYHERESKDR